MEKVLEAALAEATASCGNAHPASSNLESEATAETAGFARLILHEVRTSPGYATSELQ